MISKTLGQFINELRKHAEYVRSGPKCQLNNAGFRRKLQVAEYVIKLAGKIPIKGVRIDEWKK